MINHSDYFGLGFDYSWKAILALFISDEMRLGEADLSIGHTLALPQVTFSEMERLSS